MVFVQLVAHIHWIFERSEFLQQSRDSDGLVAQGQHHLRTTELKVPEIIVVLGELAELLQGALPQID